MTLFATMAFHQPFCHLLFQLNLIVDEQVNINTPTYFLLWHFYTCPRNRIRRADNRPKRRGSTEGKRQIKNGSGYGR